MYCFRDTIRRPLFWTLAILAASAGCASHQPAVPVRIAAAADLRFALEDLDKAFHQRHPEIQIVPAYGSSGNFYAELLNGAPFDLFLSADVEYPRRLAEKGLTIPSSEFVYAIGRIVVWTGRASGIDVEALKMDALRQPAVHHIAIANPQHAPYGRAAVAAMRSLGVYDAVQSNLVMGENIAQTFQLVQSGAAEVGIVALALARAPAAVDQGRYWEVPLSAYPRMEQGGVIMKSARNPAQAQTFRAFLMGQEGRAILKRYGFSGE
jgi:molybdate transport system substrate-binding protein